MKPSEIPTDVPEPDEVTAAYWAATRRHCLSAQWCVSCAAYQHPPRAVCINCSATEQLQQVDLSGRGRVDTFTVVHRSPRPELDVPYTIARVRLAEGPIVLTRLEGATAWAIGDAVEVAWADLADGRALPIFHPHDG